MADKEDPETEPVPGGQQSLYADEGVERDADIEQAIAVFDDLGHQLNPNVPDFVTDQHAARRWEICVRLAMAMTRQPASHPEARMFASVIFRSETPTDGEGESLAAASKRV